MAFFTIGEARVAADIAETRSGKNIDSLVLEHRKAASTKTSFDIFLSHSSSDRKLVYGAKEILERQGFSVYIDWLDDPQLDRSHVTKETAETLRQRMKSCRSLLFATSTTSSDSKWMPWELGFFDGFHKGRIAIFPLVENSRAGFTGQEYLGLYPYVEKVTDLGTSLGTVGVMKTATSYIPIRDFVSGSTTSKHGHR